MEQDAADDSEEECLPRGLLMSPTLVLPVDVDVAQLYHLSVHMCAYACVVHTHCKRHLSSLGPGAFLMLTLKCGQRNNKCYT